MQLKNLKGKVAVITGAGSGIGRALAQAFAAEGCHIALCDINEKGLYETRQLLTDSNVHTSVHIASVSDRERMAVLPEEIEREHGAIHLVFNNAGVTVSKSFEDHTLADFDFLLGINMWGVIYGCHFFLPYLKKQGEGHIINTSSMAGFIAFPNQSAYSMSKSAVKSLSETLRVELACYNIGVTSIHPGAIRTNILNAAMAKSGADEETKKMAAMVDRFGKSPEDLARTVVKAVKANRMRQLIGPDSYLLEFLKRLFPVWIHKPFEIAFTKVMQKKANGG
ncbi:MAG TPA: SDR family NAD(P)-dependent oxidoreductase [Pseudomonadales bacterium]|nr:SDR family NAD(P)-dependent oxidoreductase [Pseudomonadales bacterium]